jgi:hypothetical protein
MQHVWLQMSYCAEALEWLQQRTGELDQHEVHFILEEFCSKLRPRGSFWGAGRYSRAESNRSEAMLSVMASGLSIVDMRKTRHRPSML